MEMNEKPRIMSMNTVCEETSLSRTAINGLRAAGDFPEPVQLGVRRIGFVRVEVEAWLEERIARRKARESGIY